MIQTKDEQHLRTLEIHLNDAYNEKEKAKGKIRGLKAAIFNLKRKIEDARIAAEEDAEEGKK